MDALPLETDPELLAALDAAALWLAQAAACAAELGITTPVGIACMMPRLYTGYAPQPQRTATAAHAYRNGLRKAPRRMSAEDKARAEAVRWGWVAA